MLATVLSAVLAGPAGATAAAKRRIYWANYKNATGTTIGRANLGGSGVNQSFIIRANAPVGVAVDGRHILWANSGANTIGRANLDGSRVTPNFITGANEPQGVAVDRRRIYWTNYGGNTIGRANLDGTGVTQSFIAGASTPMGAAISVPVLKVSPRARAALRRTPVGSTSKKTLRIRNGGQAPLSISGLSFAGADPGDFHARARTCRVGVIAPGASCHITIAFRPRSQGVRTAVLQITSNDYANSPRTVNLAGTGRPPKVRVSLKICQTSGCVTHQVRVVRFTVGTHTSATLGRRHRIYATGTARRGHHHLQVILHQRRSIRRGRYTLIVKTTVDHRRITQRRIVRLR